MHHVWMSEMCARLIKLTQQKLERLSICQIASLQTWCLLCVNFLCLAACEASAWFVALLLPVGLPTQCSNYCRDRFENCDRRLTGSETT